MNTNDDFIIYGAGNIGRAMLEAGFRPRFFLDAAPRGTVDGINVFEPDAPAPELRTNPVIVAVFSPPEQCAAGTILKHLAQLGYQHTVDFESFYQNHSEKFGRNFFWLAPVNFFKARRDRIAAAESLLADASGVELYRLQIAHRMGAPWTVLPPPSPVDWQYFDPSVPLKLPPDFFFVDVGAFTGDTLPAAAGRILAMEPDGKNFSALQKAVASTPELKNKTKLLNAGSGEHAGRAAVVRSGSSAQLRDDETGTIDIVKLDDVCIEPPDYIKMDIEGAELSALRGAEKLIRRHAPALAISVYHRPDDLFELPLMLSSWRPDYRFFLRCYGSHAMETVLYAIPPDKIQK